VEGTSSGKVRVAEGIVENPHPMPTAGHDTERFNVGGESFANAASHGGPISEGFPVRITFVQEMTRNVMSGLKWGT